jgi:hypothetical protein
MGSVADQPTTFARLKGLISAIPPAQKIFRPGDLRPKPDFDPSAAALEISDARALQAGAPSEADLFEDHGFALLGHCTAVQRWESPDELARVYHPEIDAVLREKLFPGRRVEIDQSLAPVYRGGAEHAVYADWVHQDFGLTAGDFALNLAGIMSPEAAERWQARYAQDDVASCVAISCWRTIGMRDPLRHMPIALCDPASVAMEDVIACTPAEGGGSYHIGLRFNPGQRWYHYPAMRADELLTFKLFECRKDDPAPERLRSVFHTAFEDPAMPADAERRYSCEHRVVVMVLRD